MINFKVTLFYSTDHWNIIKKLLFLKNGSKNQFQKLTKHQN